MPQVALNLQVADIGYVDPIFHYSFAVKFPNKLLEWMAARMKVPADAMEMFRAANDISGLTKETFPRELIPLNTRQIARGVLNFAMLQSSSGWVLPYWAERQYDPADPSFVPRSHLGLSINVTHRNWTAVGSPECAVEPIVDPRGLVTPFHGGWSLDTWVESGPLPVFPSRHPKVRQHLIDQLPIVQTELASEGIILRLTTYVARNLLVHEATVRNVSRQTRSVNIGFAIRPFNPEGVGLIRSLLFEPGTRTWIINGTPRIAFARAPDFASCSAYSNGDSALYFGRPLPPAASFRAECTRGLANGFVLFRCRVARGRTESIECQCLLDQQPAPQKNQCALPSARKSWEADLARGAILSTPDRSLNALCRASLATLLLLTEDRTITPGPATYHQFWFRDAAYMTTALIRTGQFDVARRIITSFPSRQDRSGYFHSQQGEWDSPGQALWTVWQYALYTYDLRLVESMFDHLAQGALWIERSRLIRSKGGEHRPYGLLPPGLSAEHLGLVDQYFWDNFWCLAGIEAFARICTMLGKGEMAQRMRILAERYRGDIARAIRDAQTRAGIAEIPASPGRGIDHGMIGACCAWYPLQVLPTDHTGMRATLATLTDRFFREGLFFQRFIHSGMNPYLTMHVAHALLYSGNTAEFWKQFSAVCGAASSTLNFPEAIHPLTGGGSMGDGHHGWAAAEVVLSARDVFVTELWTKAYSAHELLFLSGIPPEWVSDGKRCQLAHAPVPGGTVDIDLDSSRRRIRLTISYEKRGDFPEGEWKARIPAAPIRVKVNGRSVRTTVTERRETLVQLPTGVKRIELSATPDNRR